MIYTVTLNPSLDYIVEAERFSKGALNRLSKELVLPGGKGNNVSMVLKNLGVESTAMGFAAGFTGYQMETMLRERGIQTDFILLPEGNSRINMKIFSREDGVETEINGCGPEISETAVEELKQKLKQLTEGDTLVLAGSIPPSLPDTIYEEVCREESCKGVKVIVDAEKTLLERVLKYQPFLVKPNHHELGQMFDTEIRTKEDAFLYGERLLEKGAKNVLVSMAGDGAVFLGEGGGRFRMQAPAGTVVNSVGAGDSMVAGFLAGTERGLTKEAAFEMAVCCGSACAFLKGLPTESDVERVLQSRKEDR